MKDASISSHSTSAKTGDAFPVECLASPGVEMQVRTVNAGGDFTHRPRRGKLVFLTAEDQGRHSAFSAARRKLVFARIGAADDVRDAALIEALETVVALEVLEMRTEGAVSAELRRLI